jgi:hypothetical protein
LQSKPRNDHFISTEQQFRGEKATLARRYFAQRPIRFDSIIQLDSITIKHTIHHNSHHTDNINDQSQIVSLGISNFPQSTRQFSAQ